MTPYELLCKMAALPIQYGLWNKKENRPFTGKEFEKANGTGEIDEKCIVMHPKEVWSRKLGTCWDCTLLEYEEFKKMGYKDFRAVYYEQINSKNEYSTTHSFILYYEPLAKGFFWFEYTWYPQCGLHGPFNKEQEIYDAVTAAALTGKYANDKITYWNKNFDAQALLDMDEIGIMDFVRVVNPDYKE